MGFSEVFGWIMMGFVLAGIMTSLVIGYVNLPAEQINTILQDQDITVSEKGSWFIGMQLGFKSISPAWRYDWLPGGSFGTPYIFLLEDIPLPDEIDAIGFLFIIPFLMLLFRWDAEDWNAVWKWLLIVLMFPIGFILAKLFYFWLYYYSGAQLGIMAETLTMIREASLSAYDNVLGALFILAMLSLGTFIKGILDAADG